MNFVIDMNLSPAWVPVLQKFGHTTIHWSSLGSPRARDREILSWARDHNHILLTHDLDFGAILAATNAEASSVIQLRAQSPTPEHSLKIVMHVITTCATRLAQGALISVDEHRARLHILPLKAEDK